MCDCHVTTYHSFLWPCQYSQKRILYLSIVEGVHSYFGDNIDKRDNHRGEKHQYHSMEQRVHAQCEQDAHRYDQTDSTQLHVFPVDELQNWEAMGAEWQENNTLEQCTLRWHEHKALEHNPPSVVQTERVSLGLKWIFSFPLLTTANSCAHLHKVTSTGHQSVNYKTPKANQCIDTHYHRTGNGFLPYKERNVLAACHDVFQQGDAQHSN